MKKTLALMTAAILCFSTASCSSKNNSSDDKSSDTESSYSVTKNAADSDDASSDSMTDTSPEANAKSDKKQSSSAGNTFLTLTQSDFTDVNMKFQQSTEKPPVDIHHVDLSKLDFGAVDPPCKDPDVRDQFYPFLDMDLEDADESTKKYYELEKQRFEKKECGHVDTFTVSGDLLYLAIRFDSNCVEPHCSMLFEYNISTEKLRKVTEFSGIDHSYGIIDVTVMNGDIFCILTDEEMQALYRIDLSDGSKELLIHGDFSYFYGNYDNKLILGNIDNEIYSTHQSFAEFDVITKELKDISDQAVGKSFPLIRKDGTTYATRQEDNNLTIHTPYYSIDTDLRGIELLSADPEHCIVSKSSSDSSMGRRLYMYDIPSRQRYIVDTYAESADFVASGNTLLHYRYGLSCILPSLGREFFLYDDPDAVFSYYESMAKEIDGKLYATLISHDSLSFENDGIVYHVNSDDLSPVSDKIAEYISNDGELLYVMNSVPSLKELIWINQE